MFTTAATEYLKMLDYSALTVADNDFGVFLRITKGIF